MISSQLSTCMSRASKSSVDAGAIARIFILNAHRQLIRSAGRHCTLAANAHCLCAIIVVLMLTSQHAAGDWLQGPYVYALYQHYGYQVGDIGRLFIAGFGSSMVFGTIAGSMADQQCAPCSLPHGTLVAGALL